MLCGKQGRTDFAMELPSTREIVGVSVTRAFAFRRVFEAEDATRLLQKKLGKVVSSTLGCVGPCSWTRQVLFIWARSLLDAQTLSQAFDQEDLAGAQATTLVVVAVSSAPHLFKKSCMPA